MGVGVGGLITNLMQGDPTQQIAQALAGPNPSPSPTNAPGQASPAGAPNAAPQQPALPPAQAYAPDPANASTIALLLKVHQQDMASNDINRNIQLMSSGFGTAQQQHDKMALVNGAGQGGGDTLGAIGEIQKLQMGQMELQNKQRFQASADLLGQTFGLKPGQGGMLSADPELFNHVIATKVSDMSPTEMMKNMNAWEQSARASGMSDSEIQSTKTLLLGGMVGGGTPDVKNMNHDIMLWKSQPQNAGKSNEQMLQEHPEWDSVAGYAAAKAESAKNAVASSKDRLDAKTSLPDVEKAIKPINDNIDTLLDPNNVNSTVSAIQALRPTEGKLGAALKGIPIIGSDQKTLDMANRVRQLQNQLSGDALKNVKNVRTQREFQALGSAASPIFNPSASADEIKTGLQQLRDKFGLAHANAVAAAGGEVPAEYADRVDKDYFDKGGPLWAGATIAKPSEGASSAPGSAPSSDLRQSSDPAADYAKLPPGPYIDPHGVHRVKK